MTTEQLYPGTPVFTSDGERIGTIGDVTGSYVKINAPMQRDYWLSRSAFASAEGDRALLTFPKDALDEHKFTEPGPERAAEPFGETKEHVRPAEEELQAQRERMERELAEQRTHLPEHPPGVPGGTVGEPVEQELARAERERGEAPWLPEEAQPTGRGAFARYAPLVAGAAIAATALVLFLWRRRAAVEAPSAAEPAPSATEAAA